MLRSQSIPNRSLACFAAEGDELDLKGTTPGSASSTKAKQHQHASSHKRAAAAPVGEELDPSANTNAPSPRYPKRKRGRGVSAHATPPTSSGDPHAPPSLIEHARGQQSPAQQAVDSKELNRSTTHPQGSRHRQQQQHHPSPSGSDQSSGSASGSETRPASRSAHPQPSWRQQEQQEPEEEAPREAVRARSQSRPFSRAGSHTQTSAQACERDSAARFRPRHPSRESHEAHARQSAPGRRPSCDPSPRHGGTGGLPGISDPRAWQGGSAALSRGPDRADRLRHKPDPERARQDQSACGYLPYNGQMHMGRPRPQHPQVTPPSLLAKHAWLL